VTGQEGTTVSNVSTFVTALESVSQIFMSGMLVVRPWRVPRDLLWCEDLEDGSKSPRQS
jgi:hypothetical protein